MPYDIIAKGYPELKDSTLFRLFNLGDRNDGKDEQ